MWSGLWFWSEALKSPRQQTAYFLQNLHVDFSMYNYDVTDERKYKIALGDGLSSWETFHIVKESCLILKKERKPKCDVH